MVISFDLDGTLIPVRAGDFATERRTIWQKIVGVERIRSGSAVLFRQLQSTGNKVGIYTTSYRSVLWIKFQFFTYGMIPDFVINGDLNCQKLSSIRINCSKYPPAFHINLHVDDSVGVELEGIRHHFKTIILLADDLNWTDKILEACTDQPLKKNYKQYKNLFF